MRTIVGISLLILGLGLLLGRVEGVGLEVPSEVRELEWVRTARGWERTAGWSNRPVVAPQLHPLVLAAGQGLASLLALVAFATAKPVDVRRLWQMVWTGR